MPATDQIRRRRQHAIVEILRRQPVSRQTELVSLLRNEGIAATQSSISRDLRQLGISKLDQGYQSAVDNDTATDDDMAAVAGFIRDIQPAGGSLTVITTRVGAAQRVAVYVDRSGWPEIVGTVSGDDTIFIATRNGREQKQLLARLRSSLIS